MGASGLSSRAIIGRYFQRLEETASGSWVRPLSNFFLASQESETYKFLGQTPSLREWIGGRNAKGLRENGITIAQKTFEATLEISVDDKRRDKTSQVMVRVDELAVRTVQHWSSLLSTLIIAAETALCYDGQAYFDTDHTEGENVTNQSNDLAINLNSVPAQVRGALTKPSPEEAAGVVFQAIAQMLTFKDDQGEPMNDGAAAFGVMCPADDIDVFSAAVNMESFPGASTNSLKKSGFRLEVWANPRLTWTDKVAIFRLDGTVKPLIRQAEAAANAQGGTETDNDLVDVEFTAIAEGSELEFNENVHRYGVKAMRNVGYGMWQQACLVTMSRS